jgi:outer membrane protein TolC
MKPHRCLAGLALVAAVMPLHAGAPLTLARAQALAVENQPALSILESSVRSARESAVADRQLPDPRLKIALQNLPVESLSLNQDSMTQTMVSVEQMFPGGAKRELRGRRMLAEADQMNAEWAAQRLLIQRDAALAFLGAVGAQRQARLLQDLAGETDRLIEAQRIGAASGKSAQAEVAAARQMLTMVRDRASEAAMQAAKSRAELARWVGPAGHDTLSLDWPSGPDPAPLAQMQQRLLGHPSHTSHALLVSVAEADMRLAQESGSPDKSIEIGYGKRSRQFDDMITIQFAMELPLAPRDRQDRAVAAKQAQVARAEAIHADHLRMLEAELTAAHAEWRYNRERLERIRADLLPQAQQQVAAALAAYGAGRGGLMPVLEARRAELEARIQQSQVETQLARARAMLGYFEQVGEGHVDAHRR